VSEIQTTRFVSGSLILTVLELDILFSFQHNFETTNAYLKLVSVFYFIDIYARVTRRSYFYFYKTTIKIYNIKHKIYNINNNFVFKFINNINYNKNNNTYNINNNIKNFKDDYNTNNNIFISILRVIIKIIIFITQIIIFLIWILWIIREKIIFITYIFI